jgi:hypothetical protein
VCPTQARSPSATSTTARARSRSCGRSRTTMGSLAELGDASAHDLPSARIRIRAPISPGHEHDHRSCRKVPALGG